MKHGRDPRFKTIEKMKDREAIFVEFITAMRKRDKEDSKSRGEKVSLIHTYSIFLSVTTMQGVFSLKKSIDHESRLLFPC